MPALILCIDGQQTYLVARQQVLVTAKHKVVSTTTADSAMELFLDLPIEMVVMDNYLSEMTGVALAREMKRCKPHVPILLISGDIEYPEGYEICDHFLPKMAGPEELLHWVDALLKTARNSAHVVPK
jgi:DNA-binding response OmpR family regulator